jgi:hypothetical protein
MTVLLGPDRTVRRSRESCRHIPQHVFNLTNNHIIRVRPRIHRLG